MVDVERVIYRHCCNDPLSPRRSNALEVRFHCVRQASGSGPIFMINFSQTALSASDMNAAFMSYDLVPMVPE
jgi:hypothetical protein